MTDVLSATSAEFAAVNLTYAIIILSRTLGQQQRWRESIAIVHRALESHEHAHTLSLEHNVSSAEPQNYLQCMSKHCCRW